MPQCEELHCEIKSDKAKEAYTAAHAIAGFQLADIAFGFLVSNGILPKSDAERLLTQAIAAKQRLNCWASSCKASPSFSRHLATTAERYQKVIACDGGHSFRLRDSVH